MDKIIVMGIVLFYFVVMFAIGIWANTRMKSAREFLVAGQTLGFFVMAIASFSSIQSGWGMVGGTGSVYDWGVQGLLAIGLIPSLGFVAAWFVLGRRLSLIGRVHVVLSVPDLVKLRFHDRGSHLAMSVALFFGTIAYMTAQVTAIGIILSLLLGISTTAGVWLGSLVVAAYTMAGGMLAAVWTDLVQGLLMIVMSVGAFFIAIYASGGWMPTLDVIAANAGQLLSIHGERPATYIFAFMLMLCVGAVAQPQLLTKFLMLRDATQLKWGALIAGTAYAVTTLFAVGIGLAMRAMTITGDMPLLENPDDTAMLFLEALTHPVVGGIALTGLLGAIMSSASSFITIGAASITRDLPGALGVRVVRELLWNRISSAIIVVASVLLTLYLAQLILLLGALGWAAFASAIMGPVVMSIYWQRATGTAATVSIVFGVLFNLVATALTARGLVSVPQFLHLGSLSVLLSIVLFYVVSLRTQNRHPDATLEKLYGLAPARGE